MRAAWIVVGLGLMANVASADVIDSDRPPLQCDPLECPAGASPTSLGHSSCPSECSPNMECQTDAECVSSYGAGAHCEPTRFCIGVVYAGHGMTNAVMDACEPTGPCGSPPAEPNDEAPSCVEASRCVAVPQPPGSSGQSDSPSRGGCAGCAVAPRTRTPLALALFGVLLLIRWRAART
ncbi:MAG: hypothetical protein AB7S26_00040 [Sandaracinaceae bacterium]